MTAEEVVLSEMVNSRIMVLIARHDKHGACLHVLRNMRYLLEAVHVCFGLSLMRIQLGAQKPLRQDVE